MSANNNHEPPISASREPSPSASGVMRAKASAVDVTKIMLTASEFATLKGVEHGADVWSYIEGRNGRKLEQFGLVRIVKAKNAPANGAERQPYYGCIANAAGRRFLAMAEAADTTERQPQIPGGPQ